MKKFIIGFTAAILVCALAVGALAATGKLTIEVNTDMKIQVNGNVFAPTDVNGNPVPIFEYNGTTYAPLRALAEAYGLEVGYDAASRMATVSEPTATVSKDLAQSEQVDYAALIPEGVDLSVEYVERMTEKRGVSPSRLVFSREDLDARVDEFYERFISLWDYDAENKRLVYNGNMSLGEFQDYIYETNYLYIASADVYDLWWACLARGVNSGTYPNGIPHCYYGDVEITDFYNYSFATRH